MTDKNGSPMAVGARVAITAEVLGVAITQKATIDFLENHGQLAGITLDMGTSRVVPSVMLTVLPSGKNK